MASGSFSTGRPINRAASGRLGVISVASGNSSSRSVATASDFSRLSPDVATITGSSTMRRWP
jgi:hypothetical protein